MVGDGFFKFSPYKEYKDYFNVWRLDVISQESGVCETGT